MLLDAMIGRPGLVTVVASPKVAEMAKLAENTYRAVNIAYVNELAVLAHAMDIDIWDVLDAAQTKPFGYERFDPGIGPGGMCIPVNPHYLSFKASELDVETRVIELTGDINFAMAEYVPRSHHRVPSRRRRAGPVPRRRVQGRRTRRAQLACGARDGAARGRRRAGRVRRSARAHADPARHRARGVAIDAASFGDFDLIVALVRNPVWPRTRCSAPACPCSTRSTRWPASRARPTSACEPTFRCGTEPGPLGHQRPRARWRGATPGGAGGCRRPRPVPIRGRVPPRVEAAPRRRRRGARCAHALPRRAVGARPALGRAAVRGCSGRSATTWFTCTPPRSRQWRACSSAPCRAASGRHWCTPSTTSGRHTTQSRVAINALHTHSTTRRLPSPTRCARPSTRDSVIGSRSSCTASTSTACVSNWQTRDATRAELGVHDGELLAVTVANLRATKNYPGLLAAARTVLDGGTPIRFVAAGQGPLEAEVRAAPPRPRARRPVRAPRLPRRHHAADRRRRPVRARVRPRGASRDRDGSADPRRAGDRTRGRRPARDRGQRGERHPRGARQRRTCSRGRSSAAAEPVEHARLATGAGTTGDRFSSREAVSAIETVYAAVAGG